MKKEILSLLFLAVFLASYASIPSTIKSEENNIRITQNKSLSNGISEKVKNYILYGQDNKVEAEKIKWSKTFLDKVNIEDLYKKYLKEGGSANNIKEISEYISKNAPILSNWQELTKKDIYDIYKAEVTKFVHISGDLYQVYALINGFEKPYVVVSARTGYFHG